MENKKKKTGGIHMKLIKRILLILVTSALGLILAYNISSFVALNILHQDLATINGYAALEVVSGSMEPTIHVGDMIIINTKETSYQRGDIVTFYDKEGSFTTHRIISIMGNKVITKGDNNKSRDDAIEISKIVGKYEFKVDNFGRILSSLKSPTTMVMILAVGVLACIFFSMDKDGNPILDKEEKEFLTYLEEKEGTGKRMKTKKKKKSTVSKRLLNAKEQVREAKQKVKEAKKELKTAKRKVKDIEKKQAAQRAEREKAAKEKILLQEAALRESMKEAKKKEEPKKAVKKVTNTTKPKTGSKKTEAEKKNAPQKRVNVSSKTKSATKTTAPKKTVTTSKKTTTSKKAAPKKVTTTKKPVTASKNTTTTKKVTPKKTTTTKKTTSKKTK